MHYRMFFIVFNELFITYKVKNFNGKRLHKSDENTV